MAVLSLALLAVFLLAAAAGDAWHHHDLASGASCQICHLGHQAVDTPLTSQNAPTPEVLGALQVPDEEDLLLGPFSPRTPTRAPPSL